ncbi:MAG: hypothetical protein PHT94_04895, partial [Candidatus Nanoarchaeia archaeon]|nr:hypothetical protein [Candidatus Nanoarchaeia archaeon]
MDTLIKWNIKYKNYLKFEDVYKYIHGWLKDEEYESMDGMKENYEVNYLEKRNMEGQKEFKIYWRAKKDDTNAEWFIKIYMIAKQTKEIKQIKNNQQEIIPFFETEIKIIIENEQKKIEVQNQYLKFFEKSYKKDLEKPYDEEKDKYKDKWSAFLKDLKAKMD